MSLPNNITALENKKFVEASNGQICVAVLNPDGSAVGSTRYSLFKNLGANATLNVKASSGVVYSIKCHNSNASNRYFQLHNTASVPSGGEAPFFTVLVPTSFEIVIGTDFFGTAGISFDTGIAFAFSTTESTYTAGSASDQVSFVTYT